MLVEDLSPSYEVVDETHQISLRVFNPRTSSIGSLLFRQFEDWPLTMEEKTILSGLKSPEPVPQTFEENLRALVKEFEVEAGWEHWDDSVRHPNGRYAIDRGLKWVKAALKRAEEGGPAPEAYR